MGFNFAASTNMNAVPAGFTGGVATRPVNDLSDHVTGGENPGVTANAGSSDDNRATMYGSAFVVIASVIALWLLGGFAFRGLPLI